MRIYAVADSAPREGSVRATPAARPATARFSDLLGTAQEESRTHTVRPGDTLSEIVHTALQRAGLPASGTALYSAVRDVAQSNGIHDANFIVPGQRIELFSLDATTHSVPRPITRPASHAILDAPARLSSEFGIRRDPIHGKQRHHNGVDLAAAKGTRIFPMWSGRVVFSGNKGGHGNTVIIRHANGTETLYAHASETLVRKGEYVSADTPIAEVGSTGRSTGPHLHLEMRQHGKAVNPLPYLRERVRAHSI